MKSKKSKLDTTGAHAMTFNGSARSPESDGSSMVQQDRLGLHGGPPPPTPTGMAVNRDAFNRCWNDQVRRARADQRQNGHPAPNVLESGQEKELSRLQQDFIRAARPRRKR